MYWFIPIHLPTFDSPVYHQTSITNVYPQATVSFTSTNNANALGDLLDENEVFVVPYIFNFATEQLFTNFADVLTEFVENGGTVIFTTNFGVINNSGLLAGY